MERVRAGYLWEARQRELPVVYATDDADAVFKQVWAVCSPNAGHPRRQAEQAASVAEVSAANPPAQVAAVEPPITAVIPSTAEESRADATSTGSLPTARSTNDELKMTEATASSETNDEPWTAKNENGSVSITPAGTAELAKFITNTEGSVYGFTDRISPVTIAAAMARLSRRGDDMRVTLLDEFIGKVDKDEQLLHRVITAYGDDSVQQLVGQHFVVEGASILLTKKLERGRLGIVPRTVQSLHLLRPKRCRGSVPLLCTAGVEG